ncbi:MAG: hypothetical protein ACOYL6_06690 [Bacteriovoracaceae bacterium]
MKLDDLFFKHPNFSLAKPSDNLELISFFQKRPMKSVGIGLHYEREPNFFTLCDYHSPHFFVFMAKVNGRLLGIGTLIIRPGFIDGELTSVGYLGDLRVEANKEIAYKWRAFYRDLLLDAPLIEEFQGCEHFYTVVMDENVEAKNSLVKKDKFFSYELLSPYQMINVFAVWKNYKHSYNIRKAGASDIPVILAFYQNDKRDFAFDFNLELKRRLQSWSNFQIENILLVFDQDKLVGATMLWSPSPAKKIILTRLPLWLKSILKVISYFHPLPHEKEELKCLYMNGLLVSESYETVLRAMIDYIFTHKLMTAYHALSFCSFPVENEFKQNVNLKQGLIATTTPLLFYTVQTTNKKNYKAPPAFEMGLV